MQEVLSLEAAFGLTMLASSALNNIFVTYYVPFFFQRGMRSTTFVMASVGTQLVAAVRSFQIVRRNDFAGPFLGYIDRSCDSIGDSILQKFKALR